MSETSPHFDRPRKGKARPLSSITKERLRTGMKSIYLRRTPGLYTDGGAPHFVGALDSTLERYLSARHSGARYPDERYLRQFEDVWEFSKLKPEKRQTICREIDGLLEELGVIDSYDPELEDILWEEVCRAEERDKARNKRIDQVIEEAHQRFLARTNGVNAKASPEVSGVGQDDAKESASGDAQGHGSQEQQPGAEPLAGFMFDGEASPEPPAMLVKKLVTRDGVVFIGGQSGAGKTFIAVYLAVMLASGGVFFGHKVIERVGVVIFAAEGEGTIANRVEVARLHQAQGEVLPIAWLGGVPNLAEKKEIRAMIARLRAVDARFRAVHGVRLGAIIFDTLAATFDLEDENSNSEAARTIRKINEMGRALNAVAIPVHHYGKAADTGLRGGSGWRAGCDAVLSVLADRNEITGSCRNRSIALAKSRVGEEGWTSPFDLRFVKLGEDEDGDPFGACYVEPGNADDTIIITTQKQKPLPRDAKAYLDALHVVLSDKGEKVRPFGLGEIEVRAVEREAVRDEFYRSRPADGEDEKKIVEARRKAFKRGEDDARDRKLIATYEVGGRFLVWLVREPSE